MKNRFVDHKSLYLSLIINDGKGFNPKADFIENHNFQSIGPLCVCVSVCLFTFEVPFNGLFAPTSRSRMSKMFRDSESLGKSNGKKWSHI